jgi:hypothetical protein
VFTGRSFYLRMEGETLRAWTRVVEAGDGVVLEADDGVADYVVVEEGGEGDGVETGWISQCLIVQFVIGTEGYLRDSGAPVKAVEPRRMPGRAVASSSKGHGSVGVPVLETRRASEQAASATKDRPVRRSSRRRNNK